MKKVIPKVFISFWLFFGGKNCEKKLWLNVSHFQVLRKIRPLGANAITETNTEMFEKKMSMS